MDGIFIFLLLIFLLWIIYKAVQDSEKEEARKAVLNQMRQKSEAEINALRKERDEIVEKLTSPLVRAKAFYDATGLLVEMLSFVRTICKEPEFMKFVGSIKEEGGDTLDTAEHLYSGLQFFVIKDIIRLYKLQGKYKDLGIDSRKGIDLKTYSGQLMYCMVSTLMKQDEKSIFTYHDFESEMNDCSIYGVRTRKIISDALRVYANADVHARASDGHEDFAFCIVLHNYNEAYEDAYRKKMERMGKMIEGEAYTITSEETNTTSNETAEDVSLAETVEVTYTAFGYEEAGETTFDMEVSERDMGWLMDAESEGETLDSDFISENRKKLHKKILRAIRNNMEVLGMDPDDGMVEKRYATLVREFHAEASQNEMHLFADDDDIEYSLTL